MQQQSTIFSAIIFLALLIIVIVTVQRYFNAQKIMPEEQMPLVEVVPEENTQEVEPAFPTITAAEFLRLRDALVIDMRSFEAFTEAHIRGSLFFADVDLTLTSGQDIILITDDNISEQSLATLHDTPIADREIRIYSEGLRAYEERGGVIIRQNSAENFHDLAKVSFVEPRDLYVRNTEEDQNALLILDVRRAGNYNKKHIENAINIPIDNLEARYKELLTTTRDLYVYGVDDEQSFQAGALLFDLGILDAQTVKGGLNAWQEFEYPVVTPQSTTPMQAYGV